MSTLVFYFFRMFHLYVTISTQHFSHAVIQYVLTVNEAPQVAGRGEQGGAPLCPR